MTTVTTQEYTCHLPLDVVAMLQRAVTLRQLPPDALIAEALRFTLQPLRQEALQRLQHQIQTQQTQSVAARQRHVTAHLPDQAQQRLAYLLERNRAEEITAQEREELQQLFDQIEAVAVEKAAALWLLGGRAPDTAMSQ